MRNKSLPGLCKSSPLRKEIELKLNKPPKKSKIQTGIFVKGGGGSSGHKVYGQGKIGYTGKYGEISLHPSIISESSKYHSLIKPDVKIGITTDFGKIKKLFKSGK